MSWLLAVEMPTKLNGYLLSFLQYISDGQITNQITVNPKKSRFKKNYLPTNKRHLTETRSVNTVYSHYKYLQ